MNDLKKLHLANKKNAGKTTFYLITFSLLFAAIAIFVTLSFFNHPAFDDYYFTVKTKTEGFWAAQINWYFEWTGRYFSTAVLSLNPIVFDFFLGYKLIPIVLIGLLLSSFFLLIKELMPGLNLTTYFLLTFSILFLYLYQMPSVSQGFYWLAGSITYQLGNILFILFFYFLIRLYHSKGSFRMNIIIAIVLLIATIGSNETIMLLTDALLGIIFLIDLILYKNLRKWLIILLITGITTSLIVFLCPGNVARIASESAEYTSPHLKDLSFSIKASIFSIISFSWSWLRSGQVALFTLLFIPLAFRAKRNNPSAKIFSPPILISLLIYFLLLFLSFFPIHWTTGSEIAAARPVNISYLFFLSGWFYNILLIVYKFKKNHFSLSYPLFLALISGIVINTIFTKNNISIASHNLISGTAYEYNEQQKARYLSIFQCRNGLCEVPALTRLPKTIFFSEISYDEKDWWNQIFAKYFKRDQIRIKQPPEQEIISFRLEVNTNLTNTHSLVSDQSHSGEKSSMVQGTDAYSATIDIKANELGIRTSLITLSCWIKNESAETNAVLVFSVVDKDGKSKFWKGKGISSEMLNSNQWSKVSMPISWFPEEYGNDDRIIIYVWNRNENKLFIDDFEIVTH